MTDRCIRNMNVNYFERKYYQKKFLTGDLVLVVFPRTSQPSEAWSVRCPYYFLRQASQRHLVMKSWGEWRRWFMAGPTCLTLFSMTLPSPWPSKVSSAHSLWDAPLVAFFSVNLLPSTRIISDTYWCYISHSPCWILLFEQNIKIFICTCMLLLFSH